MRLKKYIEFINEELREEEFNAILDKISKKEPLTDEEQKELDYFDGEFDTSPQDEVEFDIEGDLRVNGKRYNPYGIPEELYDDDEKTMADYKPTDLDDDLKRYIIEYLEKNFTKRQVSGAFAKQLFDNNDQMLRPEEVIRKTMWDMEINDIQGVRQFIKNWIENV